MAKKSSQGAEQVFWCRCADVVFQLIQQGKWRKSPLEINCKFTKEAKINDHFNNT